MKLFDYLSVETVEEACTFLASHGADAAVLAGGTDLLIESRRPSGKVPKLVLDISRVHDLAGLIESDDRIAIKPLTTHSQLARSKVLQQFASCLGSAASSIGSPQIRSRGTVGGNIMNAAACADTVPPLIALGATVTLQSQSGRRELNLGELFIKPYQTRANPDELLIDILFEKLPPSARSAFIKLGRRNALAISRLSVAAILEIGNEGTIVDARIVPGAAFPTWKRVTAAEQMLLGEKPVEKLFAAAGQRVSEEMIKETGRRWSTEYKEPVIAVLVRRALEQCVAQILVAVCKDSAVSRVSKPADSMEVHTTKAFRRPADLEVGDTAGLEACVTGGARSRNGHGQPSKTTSITTTINGRPYALTVPANCTLLDLLRDHLGLAGTKCGCEIGECGACTVLLDGQSVNSCLVLAPQIAGREVVTVEGLAQNGRLHPLQESFLDHDAAHCGFCTPGMLMSAKALLDWNPQPTETEIRTAISGNLCRCTGYQQIVTAIEKASANWQRSQKPQEPAEADATPHLLGQAPESGRS